jgi:ubiquinone/menaquinone biosynthesis C-methylase UbiE
MEHERDALWNGDKGAGGLSWADRSRMGPLRGVIDAADLIGRRNVYMHMLHTKVLQRELDYVGARTFFLDFGCGTGRFISLLATRCTRLVAADKEPEMIEAARTYVSEDNVEFECCDPAKIRFPSGYFDFVLCSSVLCVTIPDLFESIVRELARVTNRGGRILLLEQVSPEKQLPLRRYHDALMRAGFTIERTYPIRRASSWPTSLVARYSWIPVSCFGTLASLELFLTSKLRLRDVERYVEYAIAARRGFTRDDARSAPSAAS